MKKFLLYCGAALAILVVLFLGISYWLARSTAARVEALRQEIAAAGDHVYLTDYPIKSIPAEENAYYYLQLAQADLEAFSEDESTHIDPDRRLRSEQVEALAKLIAKYSDMFKRLDQAADCPAYQAPRDFSHGYALELRDVTLFRNALKAWSCRAYILAHQGEGDAALKQCEGVIRFSTHLCDDPIIVSQLVGFACQKIAASTANQILRMTETSAKSRASLESVLNRVDNEAAITTAMKGERAMGILTFQKFREGTVDDTEVWMVGDSYARYVGTWAGQAFVNDDEAKFIETLNRMIEIIPGSHDQRAAQLNSREQMLFESNRRRYRLTKMLTPAFAAFLNSMERTDASIRSLRVLLAIEDQPEITMEMVDLPETARTDPYSGKLLHLRYQNGEPTVYSVGENEVDDGGAVFNPDDTPLDIGLGPLHEPAPIKKQEDATVE